MRSYQQFEDEVRAKGRRPRQPGQAVPHDRPTVIPRVFHRIWLGPNPLPEEFEAYGETWRRHHPEWEMRLWTDEDLAGLQPPEPFDRARNLTERADVLRYELLRRFGGVYVDTDFECRAPLDGLIDGLEAFAGYQMPGSVCNALIGVAPGHPALEAAVARLPGRVGSVPFPDSTGPTFFTELLADFPEVMVFDPPVFYPYLWTELHRRDEEFPEAYAVHHWAESWRSPEKLRARIEKLHGRLAKAERARESAERRTDDALARLEEAERRLAAVEGSRWRRLGRLAPGGRGRAR